MEKIIHYLRKLGLLDAICKDPNKKQLSTDPDEVQRTKPMWQKFPRNTSLSYANSFLIISWKESEEQMVDELAGQIWPYEGSLSFSLEACVSAAEKLTDMLAEKLSQEFQQFEGKFLSWDVQTSIPAIRRKHSMAQERVYRGYTP